MYLHTNEYIFKIYPFLISVSDYFLLYLNFSLKSISRTQTKLNFILNIKFSCLDACH